MSRFAIKPVNYNKPFSGSIEIPLNPPVLVRQIAHVQEHLAIELHEVVEEVKEEVKEDTSLEDEAASIYVHMEPAPVVPQTPEPSKYLSSFALLKKSNITVREI